MADAMPLPPMRRKVTKTTRTKVRRAVPKPPKSGPVMKAQPMPGGMSVTQFKSMAQAKFDPDPQAAGQFKAMPKPPKSGRVSDFMQPGNPGKFKRNAKRNVKGA
jgi:hypothetical protein